MNEILKMLNALTADELDSVLMRGRIMLEKKRKEEEEAAIREQERIRQEKIEQEKKRLEEIAELQRKLQELQNQKVDIPEASVAAKGDGFVMYDVSNPKQATKTTSDKIECPHCKQMNVSGSQFCANCGKSLTRPPVTPSDNNVHDVTCPHCGQHNQEGSVFCSNCGQKITASKSSTPPQSATPPRSQTAAAQVRYADESMKKWEMLPGEQSVRGRHEIQMLQPDGGKFAYYMEVTNQRILFTRESSGAKNAALAARMGGGLVGSLIAEGVKSAAGSGPKPWLEIPLAAVSNCGLSNKKEFFIVADQTYVLKNHSYEKFLPDMVANARK